MFAVARSIPEEVPVILATLPEKFCIFISKLSSLVLKDPELVAFGLMDGY
jgi:hypothetical protein